VWLPRHWHHSDMQWVVSHTQRDPCELQHVTASTAGSLPCWHRGVLSPRERSAHPDDFYTTHRHIQPLNTTGDVLYVQLTTNITKQNYIELHGNYVTDHLIRARLTIRGGFHTNVRRGPFSHTCSLGVENFFLWFLWECTFLPSNSWRPFLVIVVRVSLH